MISMNGRPTTVNLTGPVNRPGLIPTIRVVSTARKRGNHVRGISALSNSIVIQLEAFIRIDPDGTRHITHVIWAIGY